MVERVHSCTALLRLFHSSPLPALPLRREAVASGMGNERDPGTCEGAISSGAVAMAALANARQLARVEHGF